MPQYTQDQIAQLWVQNGGDPAKAYLASAVAMGESSGNSNAYNGKDPHGGSFGLFQINGVHGDKASYDVTTNIRTAIALSDNGKNWKPWGAYTGGNYKKFYNASYDPSRSPGEDSADLMRGSGKTPADGRSAADYNVVAGNDVDKNTFAQVEQNNIVIKDGLDEVAWYNDNNLVTGNPRARRLVDPITFQIQLHDTEDFILTNTGKGGPLPIEIQLNASMKEYNIVMKHVYSNQRTRTGFHITLWGQQADMIEGSCTTGVFMNQFGLTDFFSTSTINDDLKHLVTSGYLFSSVPDEAFPSNDQDAETQGVPNSAILAAGGITGGGVSVATTQGGNADFDKIVQKYAPGDPSKAFRVAAQDAFVEFLSLFKNNGMVWYRTLGYEDNIGEQRDQTHIQAYSPKVGLSTAQIGARNNDVMTRGHVLMKFKNTTYLGYFKTLSWTMDANNPFQWNFSFTFQVEKTLGFVYTPING